LFEWGRWIGLSISGGVTGGERHNERFKNGQASWFVKSVVASGLLVAVEFTALVVDSRQP
jgi:hypothetical protein